MRPKCVECGFVPPASVEAAIAVVERSVDELIAAAEGAKPTGPDDGSWSAAQYLWHVVDVLRFGVERIITISVDPDAGAMPWDADEMMQVRSRSPHSVPVGVEALRYAASQWVAVARLAPEFGTTEHPALGGISLLESLTRNAHEVVHHTFDIAGAG